MIVHASREDHRLITQHDHALLAATLARHVGGDGFPSLDDPALLDAIALHDSGWPRHDDAPCLDAAGRPLDVFASPWHITLPAWSSSVALALRRGRRAGLLASLHVLSLSTGIDVSGGASPEALQKRFDVNVFQQRQIELQHRLRSRLRLPADGPTVCGLCPGSVAPHERRLRFELLWLQACDAMSLVACGVDGPILATRPAPRAPDDAGAPLALRVEGGTTRVDPWPFRAPRLEMQVPCRRLPPRAWPTRQAFLRAFRAVPVEPATLRLAR